MKGTWISVLLLATQFIGCFCNNGICTSTVVQLVYTTRYKTKLVYYSQHYRYNCGIFGWDWEKCSAYRTRSYYTSTSYSTPVYQLSTTQYCCPGYTGSASNGYCTAKCIPNCAHGTCTSPSTCTCSTGWTGDTCNEAICTQGCTHGACIAPDTCSCDPGWTGPTCGTDIPECLINNGGCDHVCVEAVGSYGCQCTEGYRISNDDFHLCEDIDECTEGIVIIADTLEEAQLQYNESLSSSGDGFLNLPWCQQGCVNTNGSYECDCNTGYYLDTEDNSTCIDINECDQKNGRCEQLCHNTNGSYYCTCREGFLLLEDNKGCTDHDECNSSIFSPNCSQICHNTHGGYRCSCIPGYRLDHQDLKYCHDVDECANEGLNECNHVCHNTIGSYYCTCNTGYEKMADNITCIDINECQVNNGGCHHECLNQQGTYQCQCHPGYVLSQDQHSCYGELCVPSLKMPTNGGMDCTGPQVTGDSCHFSCESGYQLAGSNIRECLSNHSWSGVDSSCPPLQCPIFEAPMNALIVSPCDHSFKSECTIICDEGYHVTNKPTNHHQWIQSCVLHASQSSVQWSEALSCSASDPCDGNPCNPGVCSLTMTGDVSCDCEGTLRFGRRCDTSYISVDPIPPMSVNVSQQIVVTSSLLEQRELDISTDSSTKLMAKPQALMLNRAATQKTSTDSFMLKATQPGIYGVRYQINPSTNVVLPDNTIVLVKGDPSGQTGADNYFNEFGLDDGILKEGCCTHRLPETSQCTSKMVLSSTCEWASVRDSHKTTKGVVFIGSHAVTLPLSISGMSVDTAVSTPSSFELSIPFNSSINCSTCTHTSKVKSSNCLSTTSAVFDYNAHTTELFLSTKSLIKTVLSIIQPLFPSWLSINVWPSTDTPAYSNYDYTSMLVTGKDLQSIPYCSIIKPFDNTLYYVLRSKVPLHVKIDSFNTFLYTLQLDPQCIVIDMCSSVTPTVHFHVPSDLQPSQLTILRYFQRLVSDNGKLSISTVSISQNGLQSNSIRPDKRYWAGSGFVSPSSNTYEFQAQVKLDKMFMGGDLEAHVLFDGLVYYTSTQLDKQKVPGLLEGDIELRVSTVINGTSTNKLVFRGNEAIFSYPGRSSGGDNDQPSILTSGISFKLTYNGQLSLPFSEVFTASEECPVDGFLALDNDLRINNFTIASDCLELRIGQLMIPDSFTHVLLFEGFSSADSKSSFAISSKLSSLKFSLGNFFHLRQQDSPYNALELTYASEYKSILLTGVFHDVNVSLFDGHLTTDLYIYGSSVTFKGLTTLFLHYDVNVTGTASLNTINTELMANFKFVDGVSRFKVDLTNYLQVHVKNEYNNIMEGKAKLNLVNSSTEAMLNRLTSAIESIDGEINAMRNRQNKLNQTISSLSTEVKNLKNYYSSLLLGYGLSPEQFCFEISSGEECPLISKKTVKCETCRKTVEVARQNICYRMVKKQRMVTAYRMIESKEWRYESKCYSCWKVLWYVLPFFSRSSCCYTQSQPYLRNTSVPYQVTESYMEQEEYTCTGYINEEKNGLSCNNTIDSTPNGTCITVEISCLEKKWNDIKNTFYASIIGPDYRKYMSAKVNLTLAELEYSLIDKKIAHLMEERKVMSVIIDSMVSAQAIRSKLKSEISQDIEIFTKLFDEGKNEIKSIEILDIDFSYTLTNHTPLSVPVRVKLNYSNEISEAVMQLEFRNPLDIVYRQLSGEILTHILAIEQNRNKRQAMQMTSVEAESYLAVECEKLHKMEGFILRIIHSLNSSISAFERNMNLLKKGRLSIDSELTNTSNTGLDSTNDIYQSIAEYGEFRNYSMKRFQELIMNYAFLQWQLDFDIQYSNDSSDNSYDGVSCIGLADCLQSVLFDLIYAIKDTPLPKADSILMKANSIKDDITTMSTHSLNNTFAMANQTLYSFLDIFDDLKSMEFWCSAPPMFLEHSLASIDVQNGGVLEITCDVYSQLPVQYIWRRDSIVLSSSSKILTVYNVDRTDAGQYQCTATNSAGSVESLISVVNVLVKPVIRAELEARYEVVERYSNGVRLSCQADGWPSPGWKWLFQRSLDDTATEIEGEFGNSIFINSPTQTSNEGWYTCIAYNEIGNASSGPSGPSQLLVLPSALSSMHYSIDMQFTPSQGEVDDSANFLTQILVNELEKVIESNTSNTTVTDVQFIKTSSDTFDISFTLNTPSYVGLQLNSIEDVVAIVIPAITNLEESRSILSQGGVMLNIGGGVSLVSVDDSIDIQPRHVSCPEGFEVSSNFMICVGCKAGHHGGSKSTQIIDIGNGEYIKQTHDQCTLCPIGHYQSDKSQKECLKCQGNTSTVDFGSTSNQDCLAFCPSHYVSSTGLYPCAPCPINHYQPDYGKTKCRKCTPEASQFDACRKNSPSTNTSITERSESTSLSTGVTTSATNVAGTPEQAAIGNDSGLVMTVSVTTGAVTIVLTAIVVFLVVIMTVLNRRNKAMLARSANPNQRGSLELNRYEDSLKSDDHYYNSSSKKMEDKLGEFPSMYSSATNDPIYEHINPETAISTANIPLPPSIEIPDLPPRGVLRCPHVNDYSEVGSLRSENEYMQMDSGTIDGRITDNLDYEEIHKETDN